MDPKPLRQDIRLAQLARCAKYFRLEQLPNMAAIVGLAIGVCLSFFAPAHGARSRRVTRHLLGRARGDAAILTGRHMKKDDVSNCCRGR
jgi:hypothetical protein